MHEIRAIDEAYMNRAIELAWRGCGWVDPNPMVGCVLVREGDIIGEGWHTAFGAPHAEREALAACARSGFDAQGATAYVTLEPCAHTGKTPPCVDALIDAGVIRVVIGSSDPNPQVAGRGIARLQAAGVTVECGVCKEACDSLNFAFFYFIQTGRPLVIAKYAMTLDGKIATHTGASRWITGEEARARVHADRARFAAVMVGLGTLLADDPLLSARTSDRGQTPHQPARIVCDTYLSLPLDSQLVQTAHLSPVYIATCETSEEAHEEYIEAGCHILVIPRDDNDHVDLTLLVEKLGDLGLDSVVVEGGPTLTGALFDAQLVDWVQAYVAPRIFGGAAAPGPVGGMGVTLPAQAFDVIAPQVITLGRDLLIEGALRRNDELRVVDSTSIGEEGERACSRE